MALTNWLSKLENLQIDKVDLGLARIHSIASDLDLLQFNCPVVTVAGTNGKGSTVAILQALILNAGYTVGSYTSPHLFHFNERIKINGLPVSDEQLCASFAIIEKHPKSESLTYFEWTTLVALYLFKQSTLDLIILEVGLGGRLDATNIIDATIAIITSIGIDHCEYLGNTREQIAAEKAGILRKKQVAICADNYPPLSLIDHAQKLNCKLLLINQDFSYKRQNDGRFDFFGSQQIIRSIPSASLKLSNIAAAVEAISYLPFNLSVPSIQETIPKISHPFRCQWIKGKIFHLFDVAHNEDAIKNLKQYIQNKEKDIRIHAVFSMLKDKAVSQSINLLKELIHHWYISELDSPRTIKIENLVTLFETNNVNNYSPCANIALAYEKAVSNAKEGDCILIFGSFFVVNKVYPIFKDLSAWMTE